MNVSSKPARSTSNEQLKRPLFIETRAFPTIDYALITSKTSVKIMFVQYLNFN